MKLAPKGLGAERKKVITLIAIAAVGLPFVWWMNSGSNIPEGAIKSAPVGTVAPNIVTTPRQTNGQRSTSDITSPNSPVPVVKRATVSRTMGGARVGDDFRPTLKMPEDFDVSSVDPTLKIELLAKVRNVGDVGGTRSLFEFYNPPPPPPKVEPIKPTPPPPPPPPPSAAAKAAASAKAILPPPAIPLKFYGILGGKRDARRRGLFIDGEEIFQVSENDMIRNRYKIIRLGITSAEVEDTVAKNNQTLSLLDPCESIGPGACPLTSPSR